MAIIAPRRRQFDLYDNIDFIAKRISFGIETYIIYENWILGADKLPPTDEKIASVIEKTRKESPEGAPIILDIEHWNFHFVQSAREDLIRIMVKFKEAFPNRVFGNYSITPWRHSDAALSPIGSTLRTTWIKGNDDVTSIAQEANTLFPSLYTLTKSQSEWEVFAVEMIKEARRYPGNKKIIPFLWPMYHDSMKDHSNTFIDEDFWRHQLMTCLRIADGAILWHNWTFPRQVWDYNFPFVKPTLDFVQKYVK